MHFGIREHGMAAAVNGMALCGLRAYGATFFVFSDYCRPSIRLAAIMKLPVDLTSSRTIRSASAKTARRINRSSTWPSLRAIPDLVTLRPGDANEVAEAYRTIMPWKNRPAAMVLTRQNLPTLDRTKYAPRQRRGARRLCLGRRRRRQARRDSDGHRQRSLAVRRGL